jgi:transcriptional regulator with XRE-family HTH domain
MDVASLSHTFSERIRKLRAERGMNQGQFADFVGVSRGAMSYYEQEARTPDIAVLKSICEKCGVSADYMLGLIPDQNHAVSDVCLETGLFPQAVKKLRLIKQLKDIKTINMFEAIKEKFDDPEEVMKLTPFTAAGTMVNVLLIREEGLQILTMLCAIIFDGYLYSNGEKVENPVIRLPQAHDYLQVSYEFKNLSAALWVRVQEEAAKLRDSLHEHEAMKPYYDYQESKNAKNDAESGQQ